MAAKPKKPGVGSRAKYGESIPRGDDFLPGVNTDVLRKMYKELSGRKDVSKEVHILAAAIKWREGLGVSEISRQIMQPRSTVHDWLARLRDRGLEGISDRTAPNHKPILGEIRLIVIGVWLSHAPQAYGFESGLWQASMLRKMILDRLGIDIRPRTLRATLHRMRLSFRTLREVPHGSADAETRKKFIEDTQKRLSALAKAGYTNFYEDEETVLLAAQTGRGWLPRGGRETIKTTFSRRSLKVFGALGRGTLHVMAARSTKATVFKVFLEALRQKYGKVAFVTDNAASHKSKLVQEYLESTGGDVCPGMPVPVHHAAEPHRDTVADDKGAAGRQILFHRGLDGAFHSTAGRVWRGAARSGIHTADGLIRERTLRHHSREPAPHTGLV